MSFADEVKRWVSPRSLGGQMTLLLVASTLIAFGLRTAGAELLIRPAEIVQNYKLWQLVSATFIIPPDALAVIFGIIILLQSGAWMEMQWGTRRVWVFVFAVQLMANLLTVGVSFLSPAVFSMSFAGGYTTIEALWIAQGLIVGPGRLNFWGFPVSGYAVAAIGAFFTLLTVVTASWVVVVPQLFGIAITVAWVNGFTPAALWTRFRSRQLENELRRRSSHLSVVQGQKKDRDQYLN